MPLARYFLWAGGALLTLLFVAAACLPEPPAAVETTADLPPARIHSDRKWPERIVFETGAPMVHVVPGTTDSVAVDPPAPPPPSGVIPPDLREVLAQMEPSEISSPKPSKPAKLAPKPQRRIARTRGPGPVRLAERRPQSGWFGQSLW